jgi:hypothetical protein
VLLGVHFLSEEQVYVMIHLMLQDKAKPPYLVACMKQKDTREFLKKVRLTDPKHTANLVSYFPAHKQEFELLITNFLDLLPLCLPDIAARILYAFVLLFFFSSYIL